MASTIKQQCEYFREMLKMDNSEYNISLKKIAAVTGVPFIDVFKCCMTTPDWDECKCDDEEYCICEDLPNIATNIKFTTTPDGDCMITPVDGQWLLFEISPELEEAVNELMWESMRAITGASDEEAEEAIDVAVSHCNPDDVSPFTSLLEKVQDQLKNGQVAKPELLYDIVFKYRDLFK